MEQLLQLERLRSSTLKEVPVLAVSPDPPEKTRALVAKLKESKGVDLTHRFLSDPALVSADAFGIRNEASPRPLPHPTVVLVDRSGQEVWRFTEKDYKKRPTDADLLAATARLSRTP